MIKEINHACGMLNECLGLSIPLPDPGKKALERAAVRSLAIGAGLVAAGALFSSKWCMVLGGAGLAGGAVLRREAGSRGDDTPS